LEQESKGLVTRKDLFPESYQLIWPELRWFDVILYGQIDTCLVIPHKTLLGSFERLVKVVESFIKRYQLRATQRGFLFLSSPHTGVMMR
jgi:hypothetical protein